MLRVPFFTDSRNEALERLPEELRRVLLDVGEMREYGAGETVMAPGDMGDRIGFILAGEASVLLREGHEAEIPVHSLHPGDIYGEISFLTGRPSPSDSELIADEPCRVIELSSDTFEQILKENPDITLSLMRNLARKVMQLDRSVFRSKLRKRALQSLISSEEHVFPDYVIGEYVNKNLAERVGELAHSEGPILIRGEPGVGKEVLAHAIFKMSRQYSEVFLLLDLLRNTNGTPVWGDDVTSEEDLAHITEEQMRILFGVEQPGGNGSVKRTPGYVELTEDGTLLVRGIEHLTPHTQRALLEAVRTGRFYRNGGDAAVGAHIRLIATTEIDASEIAQETHPLIHGLMDRSIRIPPLRQRRREIPGLVEHYVSKYSRELRRQLRELPKETLKALVNHTWPGNDMELSATLKRAILVSEGGVLRPSDVYFDLKRVEGTGKLDLLRFKPVRQALVSPLFPAVLQSAVTPFFFILLAFLFLGPQDLNANPAALFAWAVGWPVLIIGAFVWSRFWCSLCPIGTLSKLAKKIVSFERPFPTFLKNHSDFVIAGAVLGIIWFETATDIRNSPMNLALLLALMLVSATAAAIYFERQSWCLYLCGLGGMIGLLSKASMVELRADRNVCISQCSSNECLLGTGDHEGCPFGQSGPKLHSNRLCKLCGICLKNCRHGAWNLNLRIPGRELWEIRHTNVGTAFLVLGMMGGLLSEMFGKTSIYETVTAFLPLPEIGRFTVFFLVVLVAVNLLLCIATALSYRVYGDTFQENYSRYGLSLLPLALAAFMSFHLYYLVNLGVQLPILAGERFDFELFRKLVITVPEAWTHALQQLVVWVGLLWSLNVIYRLGRASHERLSTALLGILPHAAAALLLALLFLKAISYHFYS